ncbi:MAG: aldo/keto reductase [Tissierellia bacterium]|nr:aldo/keto reductase [Tissierellia bacterium]
MKYFDFNGEKISRLGYGCMRFPVIDGDNSKIDEEKSEKLLLYAIENGVNYIDTAYPYHGENSEKFLRKFLTKNKLRDKINLISKLPCWMIKEKEDFEKIFNEQLERLQTDHLDFYLLHSLDLKTFNRVKDLGVLDFISELKQSGKVRNLGFSFHDEYDCFVEIINSYDWDFCQIQLNYLDIDYQAGLKGYKLAKEKNIPMVIMEPVKGGRLATPPSETLELFEKFKPQSPAQLSIEFPLSLTNVMTVLSGMNEKEQIDENIQMADSVEAGNLSEDKKALYDSVRKLYKKRERIGCTACEYCMPCTVKINIPKVFRLWNNAYLYDEEDKSKKEFKEYLKDGVSPQECIQCGKCEKACPQNLEIIDGLQEALKYLS